jgi:catechol-2,3-dioxygenase
MAIAELGHTGLWVNDLKLMRDFYTRVVGLVVTDEDELAGMVFLSARPEVEHHELVLAVGRVGGRRSRITHQISWRVESLNDILRLHARFQELGVPIEQEVTHGNAVGIYFFDPEGNRNEVYWHTGRTVRQPFRKTLNLNQSLDAVLAESERLVAQGGLAYQPVSNARMRPR